MRKTIAAAAAILTILSGTPVYAKQNSFAQMDKLGHLLAYMTEGEDLPEKREPSVFGLPNTNIVYSVRQGTDGQVRLRFESTGKQTHEVAIALTTLASTKVSAWPMYVQLKGYGAKRSDRFLLGVVVEGREAYFSSSATEHRLHLLRVDNPGSEHVEATEVLMLPIAADKMIRACFSEQDRTARQGVCHDSYKFEAFLRLDPGARSEWPQFVYQSQAKIQPGFLASQRQSPERALTTEELAEKTVGDQSAH